jgi:glyoxylase-like metal-dependent hydrolase (beta-lactamase superfamily II)
MLENGRWVPTFPKARYLIGRKEHEYWSTVADGDQPAVMNDAIEPIFAAGLAQLVEMDHRITDEIRLVPSVGHTPGHVSVLIESQGAQALITGDFMHHPCQIAHPNWSQRFDHDPKAATMTRHALLNRAADQPILVIGTHFVAPTAGYIRREGESFRFEV